MFKLLVVMLFAAATMHAALLMQVPHTQYFSLTTANDGIEVFAAERLAPPNIYPAIPLTFGFIFGDTLEDRPEGDIPISISLSLNGEESLYPGIVRFYPIGNQIGGYVQVKGLQIGFAATGDPGSSVTMNTIATATVPEPSSFAWLAIGLFIGGCKRWMSLVALRKMKGWPWWFCMRSWKCGPAESGGADRR